MKTLQGPAIFVAHFADDVGVAVRAVFLDVVVDVHVVVVNDPEQRWDSANVVSQNYSAYTFVFIIT